MSQRSCPQKKLAKICLRSNDQEIVLQIASGNSTTAFVQLVYCWQFVKKEEVSTAKHGRYEMVS